MTPLWFRPTRYLTIVVSLLPGPRQYGFGWNWRGHVWGVWREVGTAFWRWHTPTKIDPMPEPIEGYEWGVADDGSLIHVPRVVSPEQQEGKVTMHKWVRLRKSEPLRCEHCGVYYAAQWSVVCPGPAPPSPEQEQQP